MVRCILACSLVGLITTGCASYDSRPTAANYCLGGNGGACSSAEGGGDCQPCPHAVKVSNTSSGSSGPHTTGRLD